MSENDTLHKEAILFCKYIVNAEPESQIVDNYINANKILSPNVNSKEISILNKCYKAPILITFFDAGLCFLNPFSGFRHKIFIMLAILEANPKYSKYFISQKQTLYSIIKVILKSFSAVFKAIIGVILLKLINYKKA